MAHICSTAEILYESLDEAEHKLLVKTIVPMLVYEEIPTDCPEEFAGMIGYLATVGLRTFAWQSSARSETAVGVGAEMWETPNPF